MENIIQQLEHILVEYTPQVQRIPPEKFEHKTLPEKWSDKEILGHLIDSALTNIRRFVVAQYEERPFIVYDQDIWVKAAAYQTYPKEDLLRLWELLNKHIVILWKNLPVAAQEKEVMTQDIHTVKWLAADYNKHLLHHLHKMLNLEPIPYP